MTYHCVYFVQSSFSPRHYCLYLTNILSQRLYNIWYAYLPIIIRNGCHEKYLQPAPAGCIAAQYPPIRACKDSIASRTTYFYVRRENRCFKWMIFLVSVSSIYWKIYINYTHNIISHNDAHTCVGNGPIFAIVDELRGSIQKQCITHRQQLLLIFAVLVFMFILWKLFLGKEFLSLSCLVNIHSKYIARLVKKLLI